MSHIDKPSEIHLELTKTPGMDVEDGNKLTTIDTVHQDEALKVLTAYVGEETWTEKEETQVRRIIDFRLMPVLCITYGLQYYDKAMLSQAVGSLRLAHVSTKTDQCAGSIWTADRSAIDDRKPLLLLRSHILPRVYCRGISCNDTRSKISYRARCLCDRHSLGYLSDPDHSLPQLPSPLRSALFPRILGKWYQSHVHDDCSTYPIECSPCIP